MKVVEDFSLDYLSDSLEPLESAITYKLLPALTGRHLPGPLERKHLALPIHLGSLGITQPLDLVVVQHRLSNSICSQIIRLIVDQAGCVADIVESISDQKVIKINARKEKLERLSTAAIIVRSPLESIPHLSMDLASEKGASIWLSALPIQAHGFALTKSAFRDALQL